MSRRKTVKLNLPKVNDLIKLKFRHRVAFCEKMGRAHNWVTDWNRTDNDRNPKPKNLPSPEEAARMCLLLNTTPDEILTEPADIALVAGLIEREREAQGIKKDTIQEDDVDGEAGKLKAEIMGEMSDFSKEELALVLTRIRKVKESR